LDSLRRSYGTVRGGDAVFSLFDLGGRRARPRRPDLRTLFLLAGSLIVTFLFLGVRIPLVQSVSKRWIEPWGYFGYIPIFAAAVPFVIAGLYFIKRSFT
jgi:hypothetical protein